MYSLQIGIGKAKLVAGSKALHYVLSDLVPPIDRQYTLQFFFQNKNFTRGGEEEFRTIFPLFHKIAKGCCDEINKRLETKGYMETSLSKVIDNAIVGYVWLF